MSLHFLFFSPPQGLANRPRSEHDRPWMSFPELTGEARLLNPDGSLLWSQLTSPAAFLARSQHTIHFQTLSAVASQWNCWLCHIIARLMGGGSAHLQFLPPHAASNISPLWLFLVGGGGFFPLNWHTLYGCSILPLLTPATVWWVLSLPLLLCDGISILSFPSFHSSYYTLCLHFGLPLSHSSRMQTPFSRQHNHSAHPVSPAPHSLSDAH